MAKNALCFRLKDASRYSASRPCHLILADGTQAGITAAKNTGAGTTFLSLFAPDGSSDVANWKTVPVTGGARSTLYSCSGQNTAITSITGYYWFETPRMIVIGLETGGVSPIANGHCVYAGEVMVALDTALGESSTYGHADGLTMYGMLIGAPNRNNVASNLGATSNGQSRLFIGSNATPRYVLPVETTTSNYTNALMDPTPFGTGKFLIRDFQMRINASHRVGDPAWLANCVDASHWTPITINGGTFRVFGPSASASHGVMSPYRKNAATADTLYTRRTTGTWAAWVDLLQSIWDDIGTNGVYWQQEASA